MGTLLAASLGLIVSHVRDVYFLMITLALGMVLWGLSYRWIPVTGGDNGISGIPNLLVHAGLPFTGGLSFYYVTLLVFAACALLMRLLVRSPFGLTLRGIRENEGRMKSLGFNTWLHCYLSYVISGAFASVAGVVWAYYNGFVSPTYLDLTASSELFLMVTLGGPATLIGPVLGAGAIVLLKNVMSAYTARWLFMLGIVYIVTILGAPQGLWNLGRRGDVRPVKCEVRRCEVRRREGATASTLMRQCDVHGAKVEHPRIVAPSHVSVVVAVLLSARWSSFGARPTADPSRSGSSCRSRGRSRRTGATS